MTISLCMIVGNERLHILSCLNAFAPAFDELSLVRAIGNQEPDETEALARKWCENNGKALVFSEYVNKTDLPHLDDFGAARNQSFEQATGEWVFWCDADDTVKRGHDIAKLREVAASGDADCYMFSYEVPGTNKAPPRERLISRALLDKGQRWRFAIHENFFLEKEDRRLFVPAPVWFHSPAREKPMSSNRNLRILNAALQDAPTMLYYVHQEHFYARNAPEAERYGKLVLEMPGLQPSFRYETFMNLGKIGRTDPQEWFSKAFCLFPRLREPLAHLALAHLTLGNKRHALEFAQLMVSLPEPPLELRPWSYEPKWYGWAGDDLHERLCRLNNHPTKPRHGVKISLIHATRGRTQQAWECREAWLNMAAHPEAVEHIVCVDRDDAQSVEFAKQFRHVVVEPGSCVRAWNAGAKEARGDILVQLSDDWVPCTGWDEMLIAEFAANPDKSVVAVSDGHRTDSLLCMAIMRRERWIEQGAEMFSDEYESVYSDDEFSHRAWRDGVVIDARDRIRFEHRHPAFCKDVKMDATYQAQNAGDRYERGKATFDRRNPDAVK